MDDSPAAWVERLAGADGDSALEEFARTAQGRDESDVRALLRGLLVHSGTFEPLDQIYVGSMRREHVAGTLSPTLLGREHSRRLLLHAAGRIGAPWEGNTWVLDCLPSRPAYAINAITAYLYAHAQDLPDSAYTRLSDAQAIIRAFYIGIPGSLPDLLQGLQTLDSRGFEYLVCVLYKAMDYETSLTPPRNDGGRDVIARRHDPGRAEDIRIECKKWAKPVSVKVARELLGVVSSEKVTKGVLVSASVFTKGARDFAANNPRIELIPGSDLILLLDQHLGPRWPLRIDRLVAEPR